MIETPPARARHMCNYAVNHLTPLLVGVEVLVKKMPQESAALRNSHRIRAPHRRRSLRIVLEVRKKVADRSEPSARDRRVSCFIDDLINLAGLKTTVLVNEMRIAKELAFHSMRKAPLAASGDFPRSCLRVAYAKNVLRASRIIDWIVFSSARAQFMLYNGNAYGKDGIGLARENAEARSVNQ